MWKTYGAIVQRYRMITLPEERNLILKAQKGLNKSRDELVLRHVSFLIFRIHKIAFPHRTYTIQEGHGGYSKDSVQLLRTIITLEELLDIVRVIENADKNAFFFYNEIEGVSKHYYITPIQ